MTVRSADVIIVGAGHNGLTAGSYLARAGLSVLVVEASDTVGGMTSTNAVLPEAPKHRINEGAMDASLFRTTKIAKELELAKFGLREVEADPPYAYLMEDGASLCIWRDPVRTADEIRQFSRSDAVAYIDLCNTLDSAMNVVVPYMNTNPVRPNPGRVLGGALRSARHPSRLLPLSRFFTASHAEIIDEAFEHEATKALLAALPCFAPISEDGTGWALIYLGLINRAGVGRYVGGTGAITDALARCFAAAGGTVRCSALVDEIVVRGGRATGVKLETGEVLSARAVITTCNVKSALTTLLPEGALSDRMAERAAHIPTASTHASSFKFDLALSGRVELSRYAEMRNDDVDLRAPALCYSTFEDHVEAWAACAKGVVPERLPMITIVPTAADPTQAPEGMDTVWSWTGIAAAHPHTPWAEQGDAVGDREIVRAARYLEGLEDLEIARQVMTPPKFEERFRSPDGNVYHVDPTATRFGPLRPAPGFSGYRTPVDGLFISGGGTHPSAGICGVPGQLAAKVALRTLRGHTQGRSNDQL